MRNSKTMQQKHNPLPNPSIKHINTQAEPEPDVLPDHLIFSRYKEETRGEESLWKAVITQALMDAGSNSTKREARVDRARAISWLSGRSQDFLTVCSLAGLEPYYVIERVGKALERGCKWRENKILGGKILVMNLVKSPRGNH